MTINSLSQTNGIQVRQLLENCGVTIKKEISDRFEVICPQCQSDKKYAFIEFKNEKRWLKCNRNNNCGYNQSLGSPSINVESLNHRNPCSIKESCIAFSI
jgi:hypothetical protein